MSWSYQADTKLVRKTNTMKVNFSLATLAVLYVVSKLR